MSKKDKKAAEEPTELSRTRSSSVFGQVDKTGRSTWSPSKAKKAIKGFDEKMFANTDAAQAISKLLEEMAAAPVKHPSLVDNKDNADAAFSAGGQPIYAHRSVIAVRCPNLLVKNIKEKPTIKKGNIAIRVADNTVDEISLGLIVAYLYTDEISFLNMANDQVVRLMLVAGLYELERVVWLCERYLKAIVNLDNWFALLKTASTFNVVRAKMLLLQYGAANFKEIIQRKEGVNLLGLELFREFVVYNTIPPETLPVDPETNSIPSTIKADFQKIYSEIQFTDVATKFTGDSKPVACHAAFLFEQSDSLGKVLAASHASDDHNVRDQRELELPKNTPVSAGAFHAFLKWAYYKDEKIDPVHAAELVPFARHFAIEGLHKLTEEIIKQGINADSVIPILGLCYNKDVSKFVKKEVYQPSLDYVLAHITDIEFKPLRKKTATMSSDILKLCQHSIQKGVWKDAEELKGLGAGASATAGAGSKADDAAKRKLARKSTTTDKEESTDESSDQKSHRKSKSTASTDDLDKIHSARKEKKDDKKAEEKKEEKKAEEKKPEEKKADDKKADSKQEDKKAEEKKPEEKKADSKKEDKKAEEKKPEEKKDEKKAEEKKPEEKKPEEKKPAEEKPKEEPKKEEAKPAEDKKEAKPEEPKKEEAKPAEEAKKEDAKPAEAPKAEEKKPEPKKEEKKPEPKKEEKKPEEPKKDEKKPEEPKKEDDKKDKVKRQESKKDDKKEIKKEEKKDDTPSKKDDKTASVKDTKAKFESISAKADSSPKTSKKGK